MVVIIDVNAINSFSNAFKFSFYIRIFKLVSMRLRKNNFHSYRPPLIHPILNGMNKGIYRRFQITNKSIALISFIFILRHNIIKPIHVCIKVAYDRIVARNQRIRSCFIIITV